MEKLISCVKIRDDRRSKVKPIYKGNCCQCLEKSVFIWKTQWSTWPLVSQSISLWKSFDPQTAMGRKKVRICFSPICSELLANRPSICSLDSHPRKLPIFSLGLSEKTTPQSLPNHPYLPGVFSLFECCWHEQFWASFSPRWLPQAHIPDPTTPVEGGEKCWVFPTVG